MSITPKIHTPVQRRNAKSSSYCLVNAPILPLRAEDFVVEPRKLLGHSEEPNATEKAQLAAAVAYKRFEYDYLVAKRTAEEALAVETTQTISPILSSTSLKAVYSTLPENRNSSATSTDVTSAQSSRPMQTFATPQRVQKNHEMMTIASHPAHFAHPLAESASSSGSSEGYQRFAKACKQQQEAHRTYKALFHQQEPTTDGPSFSLFPASSVAKNGPPIGLFSTSRATNKGPTVRTFPTSSVSMPQVVPGAWVPVIGSGKILNAFPISRQHAYDAFPAGNFPGMLPVARKLFQNQLKPVTKPVTNNNVRHSETHAFGMRPIISSHQAPATFSSSLVQKDGGGMRLDTPHNQLSASRTDAQPPCEREDVFTNRRTRHDCLSAQMSDDAFSDTTEIADVPGAIELSSPARAAASRPEAAKASRPREPTSPRSRTTPIKVKRVRIQSSPDSRVSHSTRSLSTTKRHENSTASPATVSASRNQVGRLGRRTNASARACDYGTGVDIYALVMISYRPAHGDARTWRLPGLQLVFQSANELAYGRCYKSKKKGSSNGYFKIVSGLEDLSTQSLRIDSSWDGSAKKAGVRAQLLRTNGDRLRFEFAESAEYVRFWEKTQVELKGGAAFAGMARQADGDLR